MCFISPRHFKPIETGIISVLSSTKNQAKERDPEMHRQKNNQWRFGMKDHIGVDSKTKLILSEENP